MDRRYVESRAREIESARLAEDALEQSVDKARQLVMEPIPLEELEHKRAGTWFSARHQPTMVELLALTAAGWEPGLTIAGTTDPQTCNVWRRRVQGHPSPVIRLYMTRTDEESKHEGRCWLAATTMSPLCKGKRFEQGFPDVVAAVIYAEKWIASEGIEP